MPRKITPKLKKQIESLVKVSLCKHCVRWTLTGRPCTLASHGECDCPKCQGMCECDCPDCGGTDYCETCHV
jgi:hypothetical protein